MLQSFVDGLPRLPDSGYAITLRVRGMSAFIRSTDFVGRFSLESGKVEWLVERSIAQPRNSTWQLPRRICLSGLDFWISDAHPLVAEILPTDDGAISVSTRDAETGQQLWEHFVPIPEAADWAEPSPAWPGAQTEEIDAFIADDERRLIAVDPEK